MKQAFGQKGPYNKETVNQVLRMKAVMTQEEVLEKHGGNPGVGVGLVARGVGSFFGNVAYGVGNVVGAGTVGSIGGAVTGMVAAGRVVGGYLNQMIASPCLDNDVSDNEHDQFNEQSAETVQRSRKEHATQQQLRSHLQEVQQQQQQPGANSSSSSSQNTQSPPIRGSTSKAPPASQSIRGSTPKAPLPNGKRGGSKHN